MKRKSSISIEPIKKGRRTYGAIYTTPGGRRFYMAWRKSKEIFRDGEKNISAARRDGRAFWALDYETLLIMRAKGITTVGVEDRTTGDRYFTKIDNFFDPTLAQPRDYSARGGADQRYLPLDMFVRRVGVAKI